MICGLAPPSSLIDMVALRVPVFEGLKVILNSTGMAAIKTARLTGDALKAAQGEALEQAKKNLATFLAGERVSRGRAKPKAEKGDAAVEKEALRLAVIATKDWMRANGQVPSRYKESEIRKTAQGVLATDPDLYESAKANVAAQAAKKTAALDEAKRKMLSDMKPDEKKAAEAAKRKAAAAEKKQLSAAQAGKPEVRQRKGAKTLAPPPKGTAKPVIQAPA